MEAKAGYKTTEFWLSMVAVLVGIFLAAGAVPETHWAVKVAGIVASALAALGYGAVRAKIKAGEE